MINNKISEYISNLNDNHSFYKNFYNEIINFQNDHFIPAVSLDVAIFLKWITTLVQPENILEIGFGSGVSSFFINMGLKDNVNFISLERDGNRYKRGQSLLNHYKNNSIKLVKIDAFNFFKINDAKFDLIFLDAVKSEYHIYKDLLKEILNKSGLLICDNVFIGGKVVDENVGEKYENSAKNVKLFNKNLINDEKFNTIFLPIGDGISMSVKG